MSPILLSLLLAVGSATVPPEPPPFRLMAQTNGDRVEWRLREPFRGCRTEDHAVQRSYKTDAVVRRGCLVIDTVEKRVYVLWEDGEFQETLPTQWIKP